MHSFLWLSSIPLGFPGCSVCKESACNAGDLSLITGWGRSPGEGNSNPLQYSCLWNPTERGARRATVHGVTKSWRPLRDLNHRLNPHQKQKPVNIPSYHNPGRLLKGSFSWSSQVRSELILYELSDPLYFAVIWFSIACLYLYLIYVCLPMRLKLWGRDHVHFTNQQVPVPGTTSDKQEALHQCLGKGQTSKCMPDFLQEGKIILQRGIPSTQHNSWLTVPCSWRVSLSWRKLDVSPAPAPQGTDNGPGEADHSMIMGQSTHHPLESRSTCRRSTEQKHLNAAREARVGFEELATPQPSLRDGEAVAHVLSGKSRGRRQCWLRG